MNLSRVSRFGIALAIVCLSAQAKPVELHHRLLVTADDRTLALTLDACGGGFDRSIIDFLIMHRIPATVFVTRRWIRRNVLAMKMLRQHNDLFEIEDHGLNHVPAIIGPGRQVYGLNGHRNGAGLVREVLGGAAEITRQTGVVPHWYRAATGVYDPDAVKIIEGMGYRIAGFSVNADGGARLPAATIAKRLTHVVNGDIILAHVNQPSSATGEGLALGLSALQRQGFRFVLLDQSQIHALE
jgi:peptidoglycan/xylan/chitin deacetylase (PgdA/CDA1 family)